MLHLNNLDHICVKLCLLITMYFPSDVINLKQYFLTKKKWLDFSIIRYVKLEDMMKFGGVDFMILGLLL